MKNFVKVTFFTLVTSLSPIYLLAEEVEDEPVSFRLVRRAIETSSSEFTGYEIGVRAKKNQALQMYTADKMVLSTEGHYDKKIPSGDNYLFFVKAAGFFSETSFTIFQNDKEFNIKLPSFINNNFPKINKQKVSNREFNWSLPSKSKELDGIIVHAWIGHNHTGEQYWWDYSSGDDFLVLSSDKQQSQEAIFKELPNPSDHLDFFLSVEIQQCLSGECV